MSSSRLRKDKLRYQSEVSLKITHALMLLTLGFG